jgi:alkylation response protein AidB-like acyl-CoA dehydrogenase
MTTLTGETDRPTPSSVGRAGPQPYPDYELDAASSTSRYRVVDSAGPLNYALLDPNLTAVLDSHLGGTPAWALECLSELGERCGGPIVRRAESYDAAGHELERHDRLGRDISAVKHHPDWITNREELFDYGLVGWNHDRKRLARYGRAPIQLLVAMDYLVGQADMALCCPLELAHGAVVVLERFAGDDEAAVHLLEAVVSTTGARRKQVAQVATEITGGSDVGATRTEARQADGRWLLSGEKWFASNVGAELIVTLGRVDPAVSGTRGLALFIVPRTRQDGSPNAVSIRRLKDKMGTIGVPTGELIFDDAEAHLIGDPGSGWHYMAEMLNHTRFWNGVGSLGVMRRAFVEAASYAARRRSFNTTIDRFPMVSERLIWLQVDLLATTALTFQAASALEDATVDPGNAAAALRFRTLAPLVKYRAGEQNVEFARAAVETLGGNGYIATFGTPKLVRDAQVNTIWEGTSNICALDLLRATLKDHGHQETFGHVSAELLRVSAGSLADLGERAQDALVQAGTALGALATMPQNRRDQQARRMADLFGDAVALASMTVEADFEARRGDYRKALACHLFAARRATSTDPVVAIVNGHRGIPELYEVMFTDGPLDAATYHHARSGLDDIS